MSHCEKTETIPVCLSDGWDSVTSHTITLISYRSANPQPALQEEETADYKLGEFYISML